MKTKGRKYAKTMDPTLPERVITYGKLKTVFSLMYAKRGSLGEGVKSIKHVIDKTMSSCFAKAEWRPFQHVGT